MAVIYSLSSVEIADLKDARPELISTASNWDEFVEKIKDALEDPEDQLTSRLSYQKLQDPAHEIFRLEKSAFSCILRKGMDSRFRLNER